MSLRRIHIIYMVLLLLPALLLLAVGCSTKKNTAQTRLWHAFNANYNTYYNGTLAYIDGSLEKEKGNKDNFTEVIPLYAVSNKSSREIGKGNFDRAIEKCKKAIKLHSIKRRPEWNKSRRKTERDLEWLSRREYNPFLWKAWMLMGRSQFHQGAFDDAASTFAYMSRLYKSQPAIYGRARAWLAKCYIEEEWLYDAEDVIRNMQRDSMHWRARKEWDYTYADYYIHTGDYSSAIPYLRKVIRHEMRRVQKAREWYLLGQLEAALGHREEAYKAFRHVIRLNPPYEVSFNARIAMTEVMAEGQSKKMIGKLRRMARSDNNKDYLDQVYYAIGNIYLAQRDTANAIGAYEKGNEKATRNGIEKGVLLLKLGNLYWEKEKYADAQRCYGAAIGMLDKERKDYEELSRRSKVLDELVPYTEAVHLQDSLQALALMSESDRNAAIDRVIAALKKKEKEERNAQAEADAQRTQQRNGAQGNKLSTPNATNRSTTMGGQQNAVWYFYNTMAVQQGKQAFEKQWGKRENVDNWQRVNQTVVADIGLQAEELTQEQRDSIAFEEARQDSLKQVNDSAQNDPHKREYYLAQIPFTEEQVSSSNLIIQDGLFHSGVIFKDKLDNLPLSEKALSRLSTEYPEFETMDDVFYHLYLLYSRKGDTASADLYLQRLLDNYPESTWTQILSDPFYKENAQFGEQIEDSLYGATYLAFKADRFQEVAGNSHVSETRFPLGANRDKFLFINGLSKLNDGDGDGCLEDMKTLVEKFPKSQLAQMAGMIINGVKDGRQLHGGKFDLGDVWSRRSVVLADSDSINARQLSPDRNANFLYVIAYKPDSVNENQLLFELARYNFTSYMVRNFDITIEQDQGLHLMQVSGFRNYDEALQYVRQLYQQENIVRRLGTSRSIIISDVNLPLLGKQFSYDDYDAFYTENFVPLEISDRELLNEQPEIAIDSEDQVEPEPVSEEGEGDLPVSSEGAGDNTFVPEDEAQPVAQPTEDATIMQPEEDTQPAAQPTEDATIMQPEEETQPAAQPTEDATIVPVEEDTQPTAQPVEDTTIVPVEEQPTAQPVNEDEYVVDDEETQDEDDVIYFNEDTPQQPTSTKPDNRKESIELEDEYYELDGF
ncbi:MAG: tetratricopeptide repeat protein [Prevotella sp.]|nr:tetratricopeptide repeat protein [Prevotella sp.]